MSKKKKVFLIIAGVWIGLIILGILFGGTETSPTQQKIASQENQSQEKIKFNLFEFQSNTKPYGVIADKEEGTLKIVVAPTFETSKRPHASNIAESIYMVAENLCPTDYPDLGTIALTLGWKDNPNTLPYLIVTFIGKKADFCVGYERAKEKKSPILAGYIMMNNFFSFSSKLIHRKNDIAYICENDMVQKFCNNLINQ